MNRQSLDHKPIGRVGLLTTALLVLTATGILAVEPVVATAKLFATPLAAVDALLSAGDQGDATGLLEILGPGGKEILLSGDETQPPAERASLTDTTSFPGRTQAPTILTKARTGRTAPS